MCALFLSGEEEYMITSSSNAQIKKVQQIIKEGKNQTGRRTFCRRRCEDVSGSAGRAD